MANLKTYDDISKAVTASENVLTVTIGELRDVNGSGRLGPYVVEAISKNLAAKGIGHYPPELPQEQWRKVRLFRLGSPIADLIGLVMDVDDEGNDAKLRDFAANDAKATLDQIRQMVCV
ncbi:hypothetical protein [Aureimonas sp. AU20]|uniref:hypothetical protein n=1 Tax=Aureimonas sp. AU20 TaxID=1349819 RepID=UPI0007217D46|nr:hypothetical protein [Aureimonas sp. AU20]ALN75798.1 hypothetical protein M673_23895 [Aureimonas sp. AU20]